MTINKGLLWQLQQSWPAMALLIYRAFLELRCTWLAYIQHAAVDNFVLELFTQMLV